jgi:hypothetical protein
MPLYYLDTSALLKRYRTEIGTRVVDALFSARTRDELLITSHLDHPELVKCELSDVRCLMYLSNNQITD